MELSKEINKRLTKVTFLLEENKLAKSPKDEASVLLNWVFWKEKNKIQRILWQKLMEFDLYINAL